MYSIILKLATVFLKTANEAYKPFREKVERLSQENPYPFSNWFDENGRAYIEFQDPEENTSDPGDDKWVIGMLEDAGWQVLDYKGGYAQKGNRKMRIGKIINQIRKEEKAKYQKLFEDAARRKADEFEIDNIRRQSYAALKFIDECADQFTNSLARAGAQSGGIMIVISQNPHDVASMSTGRSWESCMTLGTGSHHQDVYCEVSRGGLVAYLINVNDKNIERPHARIHIRRFQSPNGHNIAIPEKSVYGNDVPGFQNAVKNWLNTMQQQAPAGVYQRQGGGYSDTFGQTHGVMPEMKVDTPEGQQELVGWVTGERLPPEAKYDQWIVEDYLYAEVGWPDGSEEDEEDARIRDRGATFMSREEAEKYVREQESLEEADTEREYYGGETYGDDTWNEFDEDKGNYVVDRFFIRKSPIDDTYQLQLRAARKLMEAEKGTLSEKALKVLKDFAFVGRHFLSPLAADFVKKYPETLSKKEVHEMDTGDNIKYIESLPEDQKAPYLHDWLMAVNDRLRNPIDIISSDDREKLQEMNSGKVNGASLIPGTGTGWRDAVEMQIYIKFMDTIEKPLSLFKTLPEETVQELIRFAEGLPAYGMDPDGKNMRRISNTIMFNLGLKGADSPVVQKYIKSQLHRWDDSPRGGENNKHMLYGIAKLGENGKSFIPFLKEKLTEKLKLYQELKNNKNKDYKEEASFRCVKKEIETILSTIDSVENGTGRSEKYKFHY